jgi:UDP-glucose 4-epimerase
VPPRRVAAAPEVSVVTRTLLVGRGSFLAGHVLARLPAERVRAVDHGELDRPDLLDGIDRVVSFARHPRLGAEDYRLEHDDPDLRLAGRLAGRDIAYLMLSTRKVYAPSATPLAETSALGPTDGYGRHKLAVEERLRDRLGERLTILRLANVFGYERGSGRRTFLSVLLDRLAADGQIRFDMSPFVARDFLPAARFAEIFVRILAAPPGGVLNVGSGIALPTGRLALWIVEGFGRGELVIGQPRERDAFVIDVTRLRARYGPPCSLEELRTACLAIGRRLAGEVGAANL